MSFDAEGYLDSLEPLGVRFGLERMHRLVSALGMPQHRFASLHVVGTNGKSSVTEMTAALIEAHGHRAGAYLSPHSRALAGAGERSRGPRSAPRSSRPPPSGSRRPLSRSSGRSSRASGHAVRGGDRERVRRPRRRRGRVRGDRGRARRSPRRDQRAALEGHRADLGRARAHRVPRRHARARSPPRSWPCSHGHSTLVIGRLPPAVAAIARHTASERGARLVVAESDQEPPPICRPRSLPAPQLRRRPRRRRGGHRASSSPKRVSEVAAGARAARPDGADRRRSAAATSTPPTTPTGRARSPRRSPRACRRPAGLRSPSRCSPTRTPRGSSARLRPSSAPRGGHRDPAEATGAGRAAGGERAARRRARGAARAAGIARVETVADPLAAVARARELAAAEGGVAVVCRLALPARLRALILARRSRAPRMRPEAASEGLSDYGSAIGPGSAIRASAHDGAGCRGRRDRHPRLLRARLPVRTPVPLSCG